MIPCGSYEVINRSHQAAINAVGGLGPIGQAHARRELRESYGCDCAGPSRARINPARTDLYLRAIEAFTGIKTVGCPWRALRSPIVQEAMRLYQHYETGNLGAFLGDNTDYRTFQAVETYASLSAAVRSKQFDEDRAKRERESRVK